MMQPFEGVPLPRQVGGEFTTMAATVAKAAERDWTHAVMITILYGIGFLIERDGYFVAHQSGCNCEGTN